MKTHERYKPFALLACFIAAMAPFLFGYNTGIISAALLFLGDSFTLTLFDKGMVVSIILLGALLGAAVAGGVTDRIGRRWGLIVNGILFLIGGLLAYVANSFGALLIARLIMGLGVGFSSQAVPLYLGEIAPLRNRGAFLSVFQLSITIGILVAFIAGFTFADSRDWRLLFGLSMIPAAILTIGMFFMVETPSYLIARGKHEIAFKVLKKIRTKVRWEEHLVDIKEEKKKEKFHIRALFKPSVKKVLFLAVLLSAFQQITGINTVVYYAPEILHLAGFATSTSALLATVGIGIVMVIVTIAALWLLDKVGRKPLLLLGIIGMVLSLSLLGISFLINTVWGDRIAMSALMVYVGCFSFSLGPVTWVVIGEIFPLRVRAQGIAIAACINWLCNYLVSLTFLDLLYVMGSALTFFLYAFIGVFALLFVFFLLPETKGQTAEEIQKRLQRS